MSYLTQVKVLNVMNVDGQISIAQVDSAWVIRLEGDLRADRGAGLLQAVHEITAEIEPQSQVVVDFDGVRLMDSTILGHLAKLAVLMRDSINKKPVFVNPSNDIRHVLSNMGFEMIADLESVDSSFLIPSSTSLNAIVDLPETNQQGLQRVLAAHQLLASLNEDNRVKFKDVIEHLKKAEKEWSP